jgi:hypothetical protein
LGLQFDDKDVEIFELMSKTDAAIGCRYILTGLWRGENAQLEISIHALEQFQARMTTAIILEQDASSILPGSGVLFTFEGRHFIVATAR